MSKRKKMSDKIEVCVKIGKFGVYDIDGDLDETIAFLKGYKEDHPEFTRFDVTHEEETGYYHEVYHHFHVSGFRIETDEERDKRVEMIKEMKRKDKELKAEAARRKEVEERMEYERLKKQFGE